MWLLFNVKQCGNNRILCNDDPENSWKVNAKFIKVFSQLFHSEHCSRVMCIVYNPLLFSILFGGFKVLESDAACFISAWVLSGKLIWKCAHHRIPQLFTSHSIFFFKPSSMASL